MVEEDVDMRNGCVPIPFGPSKVVCLGCLKIVSMIYFVKEHLKLVRLERAVPSGLDCFEMLTA